MAEGGIYDHLGGGYARYSVDHAWLVPHFEKMLYDNALLVDLMTSVWKETRSELYRRRIAETMDWLNREMTVEAKSGARAYASAYDADSEGEEGKFYVWTEAEVDLALGDKSSVFKEFYDVTEHGNWEGKNVIRRVSTVGRRSRHWRKTKSSPRHPYGNPREANRRTGSQGSRRLERSRYRRRFTQAGL